jgi:hypothetical protein
MLAFTIFIFICDFTGMFLGTHSWRRFWSLINQYQIYQTFVLFGVYIPPKLAEFWTDLNFSTFSFSFLIDLGLPNSSEWFGNEVELPQQKEMYKKVGLRSNSMFINHTYLILILLIIILFDMAVTPCIYYAMKKKGGKIGLWAIKLGEFFHFTVYIRMFKEAFLFIMV